MRLNPFTNSRRAQTEFIGVLVCVAVWVALFYCFALATGCATPATEVRATLRTPDVSYGRTERVDYLTLQELLVGELPCAVTLRDAYYYTTTGDWLNGPFANAFFDYLTAYQISHYAPEANDCDKFGNHAESCAQALNARTVRSRGLLPGGLAFGRLDYFPAAGGHEINWFVYAVAKSDRWPLGWAVGFYEPQQYHTVELNAADEKSARKVECFNRSVEQRPARLAHTQEVVGSIPTTATNLPN